MAADPQRWLSVEEYLELDSASLDLKYEYLSGQIRAMNGGTTNHAWLSINMLTQLNEQLRSGPCLVYNSDMRVQLAHNCYVYPDVTISCDVADAQGENVIVRAPHLVVEVLLPSTEAYDRGEKFARYQSCASVQEYVLVNYRQQLIEVFRRQGAKWSYAPLRPVRKSS
ncbi:Uma2 family endonuclease [Ktedonosporobacter rubrisoli]|uniref:Uma2 family endonuclease n=1 Tax=Ktedonosporobacter rubrisoli TaxID=2509675 RepID=A0A4P6JZC4_KTERU|nr:Uma2 family endonuclease [Ktedonosporobacter rubrisoli]QBD81248.1 Uma2 family endonuclease [Ktedonosporobacter rubrisoli]